MTTDPEINADIPIEMAMTEFATLYARIALNRTGESEEKARVLLCAMANNNEELREALSYMGRRFAVRMALGELALARGCYVNPLGETCKLSEPGEDESDTVEPPRLHYINRRDQPAA